MMEEEAMRLTRIKGFLETFATPNVAEKRALE